MPVGSNVIEFTIRGNDEFSGKMGKVGGALKTTAKVAAAAAAAFAAAGTAVVGFVNKMAQGEDRAAKFSNRLGVAVDQLTTYQHVARIAGVEQQTFNMAIQRMTRRVSEAAAGTGEARDAIAELGLEAKEFQRLSMGEQLQTLAQRFEQVESRSDKVRLAFKLFDSEGVAMVQMLQQGSAEMRQLAKDAENLGAVVSQEAAANAAEFTSQTARLTAAVGGISRAIADEWIPILTGLAKRFADVIGGMQESLSRWANRAMRVFVGIGVASAQIFSQLKEDLVSLTTFEGWQNLAQGAFNAFKAILDGFVNILPAMVKIATNWFSALWTSYLELAKWAFRAVFEIFIRGFPTLVKAIGKMFQVMFEGIVEVGRWAWEKIKGVFTGEEGPTLAELMFQRLPAATEKARTEVSRLFGDAVSRAPNLGEVLFQDIPRKTAEARANVIQGYKELGTQLLQEGERWGAAFTEHFNLTAEVINKRVDQILAKFQRFGEESKQTQQEMRDAGASYTEELNKLATKNLQKNGTLARQMAQVTMDSINQMATGLAGVFTDVLLHGKNLFKSLQAFAEQLIASIVKAIAKALILRAIMSSIGGGSGLIGGALGVAHQGMRYVPQEGTYLLQKGERVLSARQNEDLTRALREGTGGGGGGTTIERVEVHVLENATSGDALLRMSPDEVREAVARKIIPALDQLDRSGVRPVALERKGAT
ncbi:MAG TPA: hypothetical protein VKA48_09965 [Gammaproteobacteria bacterium]|nr:hypothetical protein [Gammaproteobacteria bacterium]